MLTLVLVCKAVTVVTVLWSAYMAGHMRGSSEERKAAWEREDLMRDEAERRERARTAKP